METVTISGRHWDRICAAFGAQRGTANFQRWLQAQGVVDWTWTRTNTDPDCPGWIQDLEYTVRFDSGCSAVQFVLKY